jgi:hypothetical protein
MLGNFEVAGKELSRAHATTTHVYGAHSLPAVEVKISLGYTQDKWGFINNALNRYKHAKSEKKLSAKITTKHPNSIHS